MQRPKLNEGNEQSAAIAQRLTAIYRQEYPNGEPFLYERLLPTLPYLIRHLVARKLNLIVQEETADPDATFETLRSDGVANDKMALSMFLNQQVRCAHMEVNTDAVLSTRGNEIAHYEAVAPLMAHDLIWVAAGRLRPAELEKTGCVFFDVDGTKTIVDCTGHAHACAYLQRIARLLRQPPPDVSAWLRKEECKIEAYSVAGDEFVVLLRGIDKAVGKPLLDEFSRRMQHALAEDAELAAFVNFDDPKFLAAYGEEGADPAVTRESLPQTFIPSVSCGSATLIEALEEALDPDAPASSTLEELGFNAFRRMVDRADQRLAADKQAFRDAMSDPKWKAFLLRNAENRRLSLELEMAKAEIAQLERIARQQAEIIQRLEACVRQSA